MLKSILVFAFVSFSSWMPLSSGLAPYNPYNETCCNGKVGQLHFTETHLPSMPPSCCGEEPHNSFYHCCNGKQYPIGNRTSFTYGCCTDPLTNKTAAYGHMDKFCCDGKLWARDALGMFSTLCCGRGVYNVDTQVCCNGTVTDRLRTDQSCCGDTLYHSNDQACCQKHVEGGKQTIYKILPKTDGGSECCELELYDPLKDTCCEGNVKPLPKVYQIGDSVICCMEEPYIGVKELCCDTRYSNKTDIIIVAAKVHPVNSTWTRCCGLEVFNFKDEICSDDRIHTGYPQNETDPKFQGFCSGKIVNDTSFYFCYENEIVRLADYGFCDGKPFFWETHRCCGVKIMERIPEIECCFEREPYFVKNETCCNDGIVPLSEQDRLNGNTFCCR